MGTTEQPKDYYDRKDDTTEAAGLALLCFVVLAMTAIIWAIV